MKNLNNNPLQINISGQVIGDIWMPQIECTQDFNINVTKERDRMSDRSLSISEAIERYLSYQTGDFRSAAIDFAFVTISYTKGNKTISKEFEIEYL